MQTNFRDVVDFHRKFDVPVASEPTLVDMDMGNFRLRFLTEELDETASSHLAKDMAGFFDGLLDLYYVTAGTAAIFGFDFESQFCSIIRERFKKLDSQVNVHSLFLENNPEYHNAWRLAFHQFTALPKNPTWPHDMSVGRMLEKLSRLVDEIGNAYIDEDLDRMSWAIAELGLDTMMVAAACGLPWEEGWAEVQTKNMQKIRCYREEDSARKSTFDVIKPEGWTPPDIAGILRRRGWSC